MKCATLALLLCACLLAGCQSTGTASSGASDVGRVKVNPTTRKIVIENYGAELSPEVLRALPGNSVVEKKR